MTSRPRYSNAGSAAALAIYLGVYVAFAACFAAGLYWLMQPSVFANVGLAAYKPPPKTVVHYAGSPGAWTPPPSPEVPIAMVMSPDPDAAPITALEPKKEAAAAEPKKEGKKQQAATTSRARRPRPERRNPMQDYAYQPSYGFRPWF
jgi:hypothetical protein